MANSCPLRTACLVDAQFLDAAGILEGQLYLSDVHVAVKKELVFGTFFPAVVKLVGPKGDQRDNRYQQKLFPSCVRSRFPYLNS